MCVERYFVVYFKFNAQMLQIFCFLNCLRFAPFINGTTLTLQNQTEYSCSSISIKSIYLHFSAIGIKYTNPVSDNTYIAYTLIASNSSMFINIYANCGFWMAEWWIQWKWCYFCLVENEKFVAFLLLLWF